MKQSLTPSRETPEISIRVSGDLSLEGWQNREVSVHCGSSDGPAIWEDGELIRIRCDDDCKVFIPAGSAVKVEKVGGDAVVKNLAGPLAIDRIGGDLDLENVRQVTLDSVGGDAGINRVGESFRGGKIGGDLSGSNILCDIQVERVGGDLSLRDCRAVQASAGGDISVKMTRTGAQGCMVRAGGDIDMVVPEDLSAKFILESGGRDISIRIKDLYNEIEGRSYTFSIGSGTQVEYSLSAGGDISLSGAVAARQGAGLEADLADLDEEISKMGEQITGQVENRLRETDFTSRIRSSLSQRTQQMTERAIRQADERIQAVLRRMEARRGQKAGEGIPPVPPVPPAPSAAREPGSQEQPASAKVQEPVTDDERLRILQMVENKKITVEEAEALLEALESQSGEF